MKLVISILLGFILMGCDKNYEKDDFLGTWEIISTADSETGVVDTLEEEYRFLVKVKYDSLYKGNDVYGWELKGDIIFVNEWPFYIREVTPDKVIVEQEYMLDEGKFLTEFVRRNRKYEKFDFLGTWELFSETDLETGEVSKREDDADIFVVDIRFDSLSKNEEDVYAWEIKGDSISVYVDGWPWTFYIYELTDSKLLLKYEMWFGDGILLTEFVKRK